MPVPPHYLQSGLRGHAPQRNKQRDRRRDELNRQLKRGRERNPIYHMKPHVVAFIIAEGFGATAFIFDSSSTELECYRVKGGERRTEYYRHKNVCGGAQNLHTQLTTAHCNIFRCVHFAQHFANKLSARDSSDNESKHDEERGERFGP